MLESFTNIQQFEYNKLTPEEQHKRGILGRLVGIIADGEAPTRNGRKYPIELWEKVFEDPIMKEKIENRVCLGELGHPEDRSETDITKAAICLAEVPKKDKENKLHGVFDILDTPCGRILKTLCDYGCKIGVSSRGQGDVFEDYDGEETVDPDTYTCECWDAVLVPAIKAARPEYVTESLNSKTLKESLSESLNSADEDARKIMTEALNRIGVDYNKDSAIKEPEDVTSNINEALDKGSDVVEQLQEALKENALLTKKVSELQEKLSVSYAKEVSTKTMMSRYQSTIVSLSESAKKNKSIDNKLKVITERFNVLKRDYEKSLNESNIYKNRFEHISKIHRDTITKQSDKNDLVESLRADVNTADKKLASVKKSYDNRLKALTEELNELKADSTAKNNQYKDKLSAYKKTAEKYKKLSENLSSSYISLRAKQLGVSSNDILTKLTENYTLEDVENVCQDLCNYRLNMNKLPFNLSKNNVSHVAIKEDLQTKRFQNPDDVVDDSLFDIIH